jgi:mycofactocin system glycosyltransferase
MSQWRLAPGVTRLNRRRLAGGAPYRVLQLSERGERELESLLGTTTDPPADAAVGALVDQLVRCGVLLAPLHAVEVADVTVVVPARSDAASVLALLSHIPAHVPVVVVDDGSTPEIASVIGQRPGVRTLRHNTSRGPGAARNAGANLATTCWVAFIDADIAPGPDWLSALLAPVNDPDVIAVAPRIVNEQRRGWAGLVETWSGALDQGATPSDVGPGRSISYVTTAVLLVRRADYEALGGFDELLQVGEDVDLAWRMGTRGRVRYEPDLVCVHRARPTLRSVMLRRFQYGCSAGPLELRHPGTVRLADVSIWSLVPWLLGLLIRPWLGLVAAAAGVAISPKGLPDLPPADARRLAARGHLLASAGLGRYLARPLWPVTLTVLALTSPPRRCVILATLLVGTADHFRRRVTTDRLDLFSLGLCVKVVASSALDDAAYSAGVWWSCWQERTWGPLLPRVRDLPRARRNGR